MSIQTLGEQIRKRRRRLGLTLDELAVKTSISKPYLSLIETGRVPNPPSDEKLRRLEETLAFSPGALLTQAHLHRTPRDVRVMLQKLLAENAAWAAGSEAGSVAGEGIAVETGAHGAEGAANGGGINGGTVNGGARSPGVNGSHSMQRKTLALLSAGGLGGIPGGAPGVASKPKPGLAGSINLDEAYLSGVLQQIAEQSAGNVEQVKTHAIPVINRVSAGYPKDFTDLSYPPRVADDYVGCPDLRDRDAFAARVSGDSMTPKYREGDIVVFSPAAEIKSGDDCFVRFTDGQTTFKRVFLEKGDEGEEVLRLQPRNEKYRPKTVKPEEVGGVYKAMYRFESVAE